MKQNTWRISGTAWIFIAFVPWIAYWVLSGMKMPIPGILVALAVSLAINGYRLRESGIKLMDAVTLAFFVLHLIFNLVLQNTLFDTYGSVLVYIALAGMAWGSIIAHSPFTYQYARDDWPREFWDQPLFRRVNEIITAVWGILFTIDLGLAIVALAKPELKILLAAILPNVLLAPGIIFSLVFPNWYTRRDVIKGIRAQTHPFDWDAPAFPSTPPTAADEFDTIIIGSGMGGLTTGALLAKRGLKTLVVEQAHYVGGFCADFRRLHQKFVFDMGVHDISGFGERGAMRWLMKTLDLESRVQFVRMTQKYVFNNLGLSIDVPEDANELVEQLGKHFPNEREHVRDFFTEMHYVFDELYSYADDGAPITGVLDPDEKMRYPVTHPHLVRWMDKSFNTMLDLYIGDAQPKTVLSALTPYRTDNADELSILDIVPIFGYYFDGGFYPKGGSGALSRAVANVIRENGGTIMLDQKVAQIIIENGTARGIKLADGREFRARVIISNADARKTFVDLVGTEHLPKKYLDNVTTLQPTTSFFGVFLGLDYAPMKTPLTMYHDENGVGLGLMSPSLVDPSLAPAGHHGLTIFRLLSQPQAAEWKRSDADYKARKNALMEETISMVEKLIPDLRAHIVTRDAATPATVSRYTLHPAGAIYGSAHGMNRLPNQTPIRNLYLVGASATPGAGIEAVVLSGINVAAAVCPAPRARRATISEPTRAPMQATAIA
jgi:phytoene dehydrogenase-like protein